MAYTKSLTLQWGETIRELRLDQGLSLEKLADDARIDSGHLSKAERGLAGLGDEARMRLAAALGRRVEEIFTYPDTTEDEACPNAASAAGGGSSRTPATTGETRSPARSAVAAGKSGHAESPAHE